MLFARRVFCGLAVFRLPTSVSIFSPRFSLPSSITIDYLTEAALRDIILHVFAKANPFSIQPGRDLTIFSLAAVKKF